MFNLVSKFTPNGLKPKHCKKLITPKTVPKIRPVFLPPTKIPTTIGTIVIVISKKYLIGINQFGC